MNIHRDLREELATWILFLQFEVKPFFVVLSLFSVFNASASHLLFADNALYQIGPSLVFRKDVDEIKKEMEVLEKVFPNSLLLQIVNKSNLDEENNSRSVIMIKKLLLYAETQTIEKSSDLLMSIEEILGSKGKSDEMALSFVLVKLIELEIYLRSRFNNTSADASYSSEARQSSLNSFLESIDQQISHRIL